MEAKEGICYVYCFETDNSCNELYDKWLNSKEGKSYGKAPKNTAVYLSKEIKSCIEKACATNCVDLVNKGELKANISCQ